MKDGAHYRDVYNIFHTVTIAAFSRVWAPSTYRGETWSTEAMAIRVHVYPMSCLMQYLVSTVDRVGDDAAKKSIRSIFGLRFILRRDEIDVRW